MPRSNAPSGDVEYTLWNTSSKFGNATVEPTELAMTCGLNSRPRCSITCGFGGRGFDLPLAGSSVTRPNAPLIGLPSICTVPVSVPVSAFGGGGTLSASSSASLLPTACGCGAIDGSTLIVGVVTRGG